MDSVSGSVSGIGLYEFSDLYGLDWVLLHSTCRFLSMSFPPLVLLNSHLRRLVQIVCMVFHCTVATPKFNILDYTTYPDLVIITEQDLAFFMMSWFAPQWLLGSRRFTNRLHSNLDIEVPEKVIATFSAGLKYISPIAMKKSLMKESWAEFLD